MRYALSVLRNVVLVLVAVVPLAGCGMKNVEVVEHPAIEVPEGKNTKEISLKKVVAKIQRGAVVGLLKAGLGCPNHGSITWRSGRANISDDEFTTIFYEDLRRLNYNVVGNPNELFEDKSSQAEFAIGGLITGLSLNICYPMAEFGDFNTGKANAVIDIEWQVYNTLDRKTVYKRLTQGSANVEFSGGNSNEALQRAFSNSLHGLLADKEFYALVSGQAVGEQSPEGGAKSGGALEARKSDVAGAKYSAATGKDSRALGEVQKSVVTIQVGATHGSGFVIADGIVVTNQHVVREVENVRIVTHDGRKMEGKVLARDARRDIAAVEVAGLELPALKIREDKLTVGEDVFAIGSPRDIKLSGTVTNGIFSSYREMKDKTWIQSDASINPGSSGGPLVDVRGNVVGVSTLLLREAQGIFFYAPVAESLAVINIQKK